jgi:hypothetical protein
VRADFGVCERQAERGVRVSKVVGSDAGQRGYFLGDVARDVALAVSQQTLAREPRHAAPSDSVGQRLDREAILEQLVKEAFACGPRRPVNAIEEPVNLEVD